MEIYALFAFRESKLERKAYVYIPSEHLPSLPTYLIKFIKDSWKKKFPRVNWLAAYWVAN